MMQTKTPPLQRSFLMVCMDAVLMTMMVCPDALIETFCWTFSAPWPSVVTYFINFYHMFILYSYCHIHFIDIIFILVVHSFSHIYIYIYIYLKWISLIIKLSVSRCHVVIVFLPFERLCKVEVRDPQRSPGDGRRFCKSFGQLGTIGTGRSRCPQSSAPVVPCYALLSLGWVQSL